MRRVDCRVLLLFAALTMSMLAADRHASADSGLVTNFEAERTGLVRAWFSQAQLDRTRHRVQSAILEGNQVFVLTTAGVLHAMDAETGRTTWVVRVGDPRYPSMGPAANEQYVGLVNGSTLTVLNRSNGLEVISRPLSGGAGGGPALTDEHAFVPMFSGKIEAYPLDDEQRNTWYYSSTGRVFDAPIATANSIVWPTDRGYLYVANATASGVRYRFEASGQINGGPVAYDGNLYATSSNGYLYAIHEQSGLQRWRYSTGGSITRSPVAIGGQLYVATEEPNLHCVSMSGQPVWQSPGIAQLAGVSKTRVYGMDRLGDLVVLDAASGVPLGQLRTSAETQAVVNDETDRLYLVSESGLVQCLHEQGADEPLLHAEAAPADEAAAAPAAETAEPMASEPSEPAETEPSDEPADANPFDAPTENPFGSDEPQGNPFEF
jgi:outer membrane protein assembly factor BamB